MSVDDLHAFINFTVIGNAVLKRQRYSSIFDVSIASGADPGINVVGCHVIPVVINPAVGFHYFPPDPRFHFQSQSINAF